MNLQLHEQALRIAKNYKRSEADLIEILTQIDKDKTYLALGKSSLFRYCVETLNISEYTTYTLIQVTRKSCALPLYKEAVLTGVITTTQAARIASVVTATTQNQWIEKASTLTHRELEREIAKENPKPLVKEKIKILTETKSELRLMISKELESNLRRAQDILKTLTLEETLEKLVLFTLKHKDPIIKAERNANKVTKLTVKIGDKLQKNNKKDNNATPSPNLNKRAAIIRTNIPAPLLHQVHLRDRGRCTFKQCNETRWLEVHHLKPIAWGGINILSNLTTLCSGHHKMLHDTHTQDKWFGLNANQSTAKK